MKRIYCTILCLTLQLFYLGNAYAAESEAELECPN